MVDRIGTIFPSTVPLPTSGAVSFAGGQEATTAGVASLGVAKQASSLFPGSDPQLNLPIPVRGHYLSPLPLYAFRYFILYSVQAHYYLSTNLVLTQY